MNIHPEHEAGLKWGSHLPALAACLACSRGPVLEVGVGHFSTPFLHAYCSAANRLLLSLEDCADWQTPFRMRYATNRHLFDGELYQLSVPRAILNTPHSEYTGDRFGVAFLDHSPGARRVEDFKLLSSEASYVVVHDFQDEIEEGITPFLVKPFEYRVIADYLPRTLIFSARWAVPDVAP